MWILVGWLEGRLVPTPVRPLRDPEPATGDPGDVDGAAGAQVGNQAGAVAGRGASVGNRGVTSGPPGGAKQETRRPIMPGDAEAQEQGPATKDLDTNDGCLGAWIEGSDPLALGRDIGVVVRAVEEVVSSSGNAGSSTGPSGSSNIAPMKCH
ncbi:UNVERIFIED_CONTAM: hypothetical protein FKN15_039940 [Acipenser sinensis]